MSPGYTAAAKTPRLGTNQQTSFFQLNSDCVFSCAAPLSDALKKNIKKTAEVSAMSGAQNK